MHTHTRRDIHAETARMDFHQLVRILNENVGAAVVQTMAGVKDRTAPYRWAKHDGGEPAREIIARLQLGFRVWRTLESTEGPDVALSWLMGANPMLGEELPLLYIQQSRAKEVLGAAEAFVNDTYAA